LVTAVGQHRDQSIWSSRASQSRRGLSIQHLELRVTPVNDHRDTEPCRQCDVRRIWDPIEEDYQRRCCDEGETEVTDEVACLATAL
jgi:hypothetical protein